MSGAQTGETEGSRLAWTLRRGGKKLEISVAPPHNPDGRGFRPVDIPGKRTKDSGPINALFDSLSRARQAETTVAVQGFEAPRRDRIPMTFTLAVSMADLPMPAEDRLPRGNVSNFDLPCGSGFRIHRLSRAGRRARLTQFTSIYMAQTEFGVLALAFATPHLDGAPEFAVLFDTIARSCRVTTA